MYYKPGDRVFLTEEFMGFPKRFELTLCSIDIDGDWWAEPFPERPYGLCLMLSHFEKLEQCNEL